MASGFYRTLKQSMQVLGFPRNSGNSVICVQDPGRGTRKPNSGPSRNMSDPLWDRNNKSQDRYLKAKAKKFEETGGRKSEHITNSTAEAEEPTRRDLAEGMGLIAILCNFLNKRVLDRALSPSESTL